MLTVILEYRWTWVEDTMMLETMWSTSFPWHSLSPCSPGVWLSTRPSFRTKINCNMRNKVSDGQLIISSKQSQALPKSGFRLVIDASPALKFFHRLNQGMPKVLDSCHIIHDKPKCSLRNIRFQVVINHKNRSIKRTCFIAQAISTLTILPNLALLIVLVERMSGIDPSKV